MRSSKPIWTYRVESRQNDADEWRFAFGSQDSSKAYAQGWVHGVKQFYPCPDQRIMRSRDCKAWEQVEVFNGNGKVHLS